MIDDNEADCHRPDAVDLGNVLAMVGALRRSGVFEPLRRARECFGVRQCSDFPAEAHPSRPLDRNPSGQRCMHDRSTLLLIPVREHAVMASMAVVAVTTAAMVLAAGGRIRWERAQTDG